MTYTEWSRRAENEAARNWQHYDQALTRRFQDQSANAERYAGENWKALGALISPDSPAWEIVKIKQDENKDNVKGKIGVEGMNDRLNGDKKEDEESIARVNAEIADLQSESADRSFVAADASQKGFDYTTVSAIRSATGYRKIILTERYLDNFTANTVPQAWAKAQQSDDRTLIDPNGIRFKINQKNLSPVQYAMAQRFITAEQFKKSGIGGLNPAFLASKNVKFFEKLNKAEASILKEYKKNWEIKQENLEWEEVWEDTEFPPSLDLIMQQAFSSKKNGKAITPTEAIDKFQKRLEDIAEGDPARGLTLLNTLRNQEYRKIGGQWAKIGNHRWEQIEAKVQEAFTSALDREGKTGDLRFSALTLEYINKEIDKDQYQKKWKEVETELNLPNRTPSGLLIERNNRNISPDLQKKQIIENEKAQNFLTDEDLENVHPDIYEWAKNRKVTQDKLVESINSPNYKLGFEGVETLVRNSLKITTGAQAEALSTYAIRLLPHMQEDFKRMHKVYHKTDPINAAGNALKYVEEKHGDFNRQGYVMSKDSKYGQIVAKIEQQRTKQEPNTFSLAVDSARNFIRMNADDSVFDLDLPDDVKEQLEPYKAEIAAVAMGKGNSILARRIVKEMQKHNKGLRASTGYRYLARQLGVDIPYAPGEKKDDENLRKACAVDSPYGREVQALLERASAANRIGLQLRRAMFEKDPNACNHPSVLIPGIN